MRYLLAAEADKIQDFIFRSSRLREIVGASQLLSDFCEGEEGVAKLLELHKGKAIVNDGGSFRLVFEGSRAEEQALKFGADLAELYSLVMDGTISVAEPVKYDTDFKDANDKANKALRRAKSYREGAIAEVHIPYVAFCASCGVGLAERHGKLHGEPEGGRNRYLCKTCQVKAIERWDTRIEFLRRFLRQALPEVKNDTDLNQYIWPKDTDSVAFYDRRNYVAYLVADGNGMGRVFGECNEEQITTLSKRLTSSLQKALAEPTRQLRCRLEARYDEHKRGDGKKREIIPVLPLILGGDDLFALIPAPYALDFARRFCLAYERELKHLVDELKLDVPPPTVGAAVVICKSKYPYALAHRRAETLLKEAKRLSKQLAVTENQYLSIVNFDVILGNSLPNQEKEDRYIRQSLRPYWVANSLSEEAEGGDIYQFVERRLSQDAIARSIDIYDLIEQRYHLKDMPNKRLAELRRHFSANFEDDEQLVKESDKLERLIKRSGKELEPKIRSSLAALGQLREADDDNHYWREFEWNDERWLAHGMLDLLEVWYFAQDLKLSPDKYEPKESKS